MGACLLNKNMAAENLRIASWNLRGLTSSTEYLKGLMLEHDIIMVSEHWLHANRLGALDAITPDFQVISRIQLS